MQFRDLQTQYLNLSSEIDSAVKRVLDSGVFIGGSEVNTIEEELAEYVGVKHCITCGNGTDALQLALLAWGIGEGDAVLVPDFTFFSSGEVVSVVGATPVFIDIDENTFNVDPSQIELAVNLAKESGLEPRALVAVDLFGLPAEYEQIQRMCKENGLLVLEDGAQGFGGSIKERKACSFGDISTTSFFPAKPLGCYSDGGAVFTNNDEWASLIRSLAVHGKGETKYDNVRIGMNSRLDAMQAAILQIKLKAFKEYEVVEVNERAKWYDEMLAETDLRLPRVPNDFISSWAQYTVMLPDRLNRAKVQSLLRQSDIPSMVYYQRPMHEQKAFFGKSLVVGDCLKTKKACETVLSLPMGPYLGKTQCDIVCDALQNIISLD